MLKKILDFKELHPGWFYTILALVVIGVIAIIVEYVFFEHIECRVTEKNGRFRDTHIRRRKGSSRYSLHQKSGKWTLLTEEETLFVVKCLRAKTSIHFDFSPPKEVKVA